MSKIEQHIISELAKHNINMEFQKPVPIDDYPWKTSLSRSAPKCDIYLVDYDLYIEVKGFMTIEAMSKLAFLSNQSYKYYIFHATEFDWNPYLDSNIDNAMPSIFISKAQTMRDNISHQINELVSLKDDKSLRRYAIRRILISVNFSFPRLKKITPGFLFSQCKNREDIKLEIKKKIS